MSGERSFSIFREVKYRVTCVTNTADANSIRILFDNAKPLTYSSTLQNNSKEGILDLLKGVV